MDDDTLGSGAADASNHAPLCGNDEREALRAEGLDPDDPALLAALDLVRWELQLLTWGELDIPI
jgi:hypothetical protein